MRVLIVGSESPSAIERYYVKYLVESGVDVFHYASADIVFNYHSRNIINKVLFKTKINTGYRTVNEGLIGKAMDVRPDIIWVFKGMEIFPQTLQLLKTKGFKLANFNPDHPFIIISSGSGNKNVTDSVGLYDLHFCYQQHLQREIEQRFGIPTVFLPFAYDAEDVSYVDPAGIREIPRLCFQGNPDAYRARILNMLADAGIPVDVYGHDWDKTIVARNPGIRFFPIANRTDFWKKNQEYRIQLNLFREYNFGSHNMRTFEIPVVGGIQLTTYSEEQAAFFEEGKEVFFFHDQAELVQKARVILSLSPGEAEQVRAHARSRSLVSGYSFADRARTVFEAFKQLN